METEIKLIKTDKDPMFFICQPQRKPNSLVVTMYYTDSKESALNRVRDIIDSLENTLHNEVKKANAFSLN